MRCSTTGNSFQRPRWDCVSWRNFVAISVQPVAFTRLFLATFFMAGAWPAFTQAQNDGFEDQPTPSPSASAAASPDDPLREADKDMEQWKAEEAKWQRKQFADPSNGQRVKFNQE